MAAEPGPSPEHPAPLERGEIKFGVDGERGECLGAFGGSVGFGLQPGLLGTDATAACKGHQEGKNK